MRDMRSSLSTPLVSIVIPTYNHAHLIKDALSSLVAQTHMNWEAVVVNNYSEDATESVVKSFSDNRIRLVNFANKGVIASSRNRGIELAKGDYVAFLDSDDLWLPQKLERCINTLTVQRLDWICHGERWFGDGVDKEVMYGPVRYASFDELLYRGNCISTSAVVVKRELLRMAGGFNESPAFVTAEDYDLWLRLAQTHAKIGFIDEILGAYRIHPNNQSRAALRNMQATSAVVEQFFSKIPATSYFEKWRRRSRRGHVFYGGARALQNSHGYQAAWPLFFKALWLAPFDKRIVPAMILNALRIRF